MRPAFATALGLTETELHTDFQAHLTAFAAHEQLTLEALALAAS